MTRYLLDTHALVWLAKGEPLKGDAEAILADAAQRGANVFVSTYSAWEVSMLAARGRIQLPKDLLRWFNETTDSLNILPLTASVEVLIASNDLPPPFHGDPADRIIVASAIIHDITLVTRDGAIRSYAEAGHLAVLPC